jgi:hypothetical protein
LQRVVLFSADPATGLISLRHYTISTAPSGVKKSLKALLLRQAVPDMGGLQDVADIITKSGYGSVSSFRMVGFGLPTLLGFALRVICQDAEGSCGVVPPHVLDMQGNAGSERQFACVCAHSMR